MDEEMAQPLDQTERRALLSILTTHLEVRKRGSLHAPLLNRIANFLRSDNTNSTDDDIFYINEERMRLLELLQSDQTTASYYIPAYDLRSLISFLNTSILDGPAKATQERKFCLENLKIAKIRPTSPFTPSAKRLLQRVLGQTQSETSENLLSTLETSVSLASSKRITFFRKCIAFLESDSVMSKPPTPDASSSRPYGLSSSSGPAQEIYIDDETETFELGSTDADHPPPGPALPTLHTGEPLFDITETDPNRELLKPFWALEYPDLPILSRAHLNEFNQVYWRNPPGDSLTSPQRVKAAIISYCFALSSLRPGANAARSADTYFQHAQQLAGDFLDHEKSVNLVQFLCLKAQYLFAIGDLGKASDIIWLAKRRAETLGFHNRAQGRTTVSMSVSRTAGDRDKLLAWRIWQHTVNTHRSFALRSSAPYPSVDHLCDDALSSVTGIGLKRSDMLIFEYHKACSLLYAEVEDLLGIEDTFRVDWREGSFDRCEVSNLEDLAKIEASLRSSKLSLPAFLHTEDETIPRSEINLAQRLRTAYQLRRSFIQLRLFRPFLILCYSLSNSGVVKMDDKSSTSLDAPCIFGLVQHAGHKCVTAAMELKSLLLAEPHCEFWGSISGYEHIDYVYSCALVCILGFVYTDSGPEFSKDKTRSNLQSTLTQLLDLFHKYEVRCIQNRKLITLMGRCKYALQGLADFVLTLEPGSTSHSRSSRSSLIFPGRLSLLPGLKVSRRILRISMQSRLWAY
ncbi:unnamed protein product [Penicillium pancosmium]